MAYYYRFDPPEVRELDPILVQQWQDVGNPKAGEWQPIPNPPAPNAYWDGTQWIVPPPWKPEQISMRQCRLVLLANGLLDSVQQFVDQSGDEAAQIEWEYANDVHRQAPLTAVIAQFLGLDSDQMDALFLQGSQL
jgi:hypothetical protein